LEQAGLHKAKVARFKKALSGFSLLFEKDLMLFDPVINDAIMNGQLQKFEYCSELMWKAIRSQLIISSGISPRSPRESIKEFFNCGYINSAQYEILIKILEDRNTLSHVYNEEVFAEIHSRLKEHNFVMNEVLLILEKDSII